MLSMKLSIIIQTLQFFSFIIFMFCILLVRHTRAQRMGKNASNVFTKSCNESQPSPTLELIRKPEIHMESAMTTPQVKLFIRCSANYSLKVGLYAMKNSTRRHFQERVEPLGKFIGFHERSMSPLTKLEVVLLLREGYHLVVCHSSECNHPNYQTGMRIDYHNFKLKFSTNKLQSSVDMEQHREGSALMIAFLLVYGPALALLLLVTLLLLAIRHLNQRGKQLQNEPNRETSL